MQSTNAPRGLPTISGWVRELANDRLEIFLKVEGVKGMEDRKIRASGPQGEMHELVDWFEQKTGLRVDVPNRVRTGPEPMRGQMTLIVADAPVGDDDDA